MQTHTISCYFVKACVRKRVQRVTHNLLQDMNKTQSSVIIHKRSMKSFPANEFASLIFIFVMICFISTDQGYNEADEEGCRGWESS